MPVRIIFRRTDDAGNVYYTDADGQIIDKPEEENEYVGCFRTPEYEEYINSLTEEDLARQRAEGEARYYAQVAERERKAKGLAVRDLTKLGKPKNRKVLWAAPTTTCLGEHPTTSCLDEHPTTEGLGQPNKQTVYWVERELCILAGDTGVGKSLLALKIAQALSMQNSECIMQNESSREKLSEDDTTSPLRGTPPTLGGELDTPSPGHFVSGTPPLQGESLVSSSTSGDAPVLSSPLSAVADIPPPKGDIFSGKVLYVDFEMEEEDFVVRFGNDVPENFTWVGLNAEGEMPPDFKNKTEWLLQNFTTTINDTDANIVIVDQPDRLSLSPQKWMVFLANLKSIMRKKGLSVMLIVSNKPRHIGRPCGLNNIPKGNILIPQADSIVMLAQNNRHAEGRYLKVLKNRNRGQADDLELVDVLSINENDGYLDVEYYGAEPEKHMLPPNAAERKNRLIMKAEKLWDEGLCYYEIAERMELPEGMVKRWLRELQPDPHPGPLPRGEGVNPSSFDEYTPSPINPSPSQSEGTPFKKGDPFSSQILLQQQGIERGRVRVSMP